MLLSIEQKHIDFARAKVGKFSYQYTTDCPVGRALQDAHPSSSFICAGAYRSYIDNLVYKHSPSLKEQIERFDRFAEFSPGEYELFPVGYVQSQA